MSKKSIKEIEAEFASCGESRKELYDIYATDERSGVQKIIQKYKKMEEQLVQEIARVEEM